MKRQIQKYLILTLRGLSDIEASKLADLPAELTPEVNRMRKILKCARCKMPYQKIKRKGAASFFCGTCRKNFTRDQLYKGYHLDRKVKYGIMKTPQNNKQNNK